MELTTNLRSHAFVQQMKSRGWRIDATTALPDTAESTVICLSFSRPDEPAIRAVLVDRPNYGYTLYIETPYLTIAEDIEHVERCAAYHAAELPAPVGRRT